MAAFFIPGVSSDSRLLELAYGTMRDQVEADMGRRPSSRRIWTLHARRGSVDCVTEVGESDPVLGGTVLAIFDMGPHQPFVVWRQQNGELDDSVRDVLACNAYSVLEFDQ
jgi:hypothetical protein